MSVAQPPPTYALPVIVDERTGKAIFNPIWLRWFIDLAATTSASGFPAPGDVSTELAGATFGSRAPSFSAAKMLQGNLEDLLATRMFARAPDVTPRDYQDLLQARIFARMPEIAPRDYQDILAGQIFARREGTYYALRSIDNSQSVLQGRIFGA